MSSFQKHRFRIFTQVQHPLKHSLDDFFYTNPAIGAGVVTNVQQALDYVYAVLYPQTKPAVATTADLPLVANTLNDMRVVNDDGDGKAASYRWEQREGEGSPSWHKIYDMDWGSDSILQQMQLKTQDLYVSKKGYNERDAAGNLVVGTLAGAYIYGGASANTNLTFYANSGDGAGPVTGFVQFGNNSRPISDNTFDFGTTSLRFKKIWSYAYQAGTLLLAAGSVTDSSGTINFGSTNLTTTGTVAGSSFTGTSGVFGTLTVAAGSITDSSGSVSFGSTNLATTGTLGSNVLTVTNTAQTLVFNPHVAGKANIQATHAALSFNALNLETSGTLNAGDTVVTKLNSANIQLQTNTVSSTNLNGNLNFAANGIGVVNVQSAMTTLDQTVTGVMTVTSQVNVGNLRLTGNTLLSTNAGGNIIFAPNGAGLNEFSSGIFPTTTATQDIGRSGNLWQTLWLGTSLTNGVTSVTMATLLSLRDINVGVSTGKGIFWTGAKWEAVDPDTEVVHGLISGLSADDHLQYFLLAGRASGQTAYGGAAASENLTLDSTAHATKGKIFFGSVLAPSINASYSGSWSGTDLGGTSNYLRHIYTKGEHFNFRVENLGADFTSSSQNPGRLGFNTVTKHLIMDTGSAVTQIGSMHSETDTVWDGITTSKTVAITGVDDARKAIWQLKDNTNDFEIIYAKLTQTDASTVVITVGTALPAGTYRLIGIQ